LTGLPYIYGSSKGTRAVGDRGIVVISLTTV
jgi:hypothetical protein